METIIQTGGEIIKSYHKLINFFCQNLIDKDVKPIIPIPDT